MRSERGFCVVLLCNNQKLISLLDPECVHTEVLKQNGLEETAPSKWREEGDV